MRSSSGVHYIALDHVRAFAVLLVIAWHFTHGTNGYPVPFRYVPSLFPFALFDEGHTGVALFMTLSGYLFALLLAGKSIGYLTFLRNRILRLLPILLVVIILRGIGIFLSGGNVWPYIFSIPYGIIFPILPNGGWSITVEFHYYVILPFFLWMLRKNKFLPLVLVISAIGLRLYFFQTKGEVQSLAYWTIVGHIDQFALGMLTYHFRSYFTRKHALVLSIIAGFSLFYWYFDAKGGFYQFPSYPSSSSLWIVIPTIEGLAYAIGIAWYETSFLHSTKGISKFIGLIGEYSYSIYLIHFFLIFYVANLVNRKIMDISNFYLACIWAVGFLLFMMPIGYLSYRFIESPFLRLRKRYIIDPKPQGSLKIDGSDKGEEIFQK